MKKYYYQIPEDVVNYIERLHYENECMENIIKPLLKGDSKCDTELFNQYHEQYIHIHAEYDIAKTTLEKNFIPVVLKEHRISWELNFLERVLEVTQYCDCEVDIDD